MSERVSKSELKRQFKRVEEAAAELALLSDAELKRLPAGDQVKTEIKNCRDVKGGARKRQVKYLAKLIREEPIDAILDFLAEKKGSKLKQDRIHHEAERLRDAIVNEAIAHQQDCLAHDMVLELDWPGEITDQLARRCQAVSGDLMRAVHQYVRSRKHTFYKETYRIIKAVLEKEELERRLED
ncbi:dual-action ribosomal maturation protein DarP [Desulforhopalus singaporensis]|uniref:Ribosome-associated protein n=1 Tax=Desulforhopalus singaporensis TaxID=91360 RepID=A0A1H0U719_9BACT|nr:DUF615 domain-containing protein [Desulforhopalus singaporensis]SDP61768.1 ribosome-associated protein [Desulforhopalus singaporensis]